VALAYFAVAGVVQRRAIEKADRLAGHTHFEDHYLYGAYLALASIVVVLLATVALELAAPHRRPSRAEAAMAALSLGVLVSFLLPWMQIQHYSNPAIGTASATLAAAVLCAGLAIREIDARLAVATAAALLTGATISTVVRGASIAYGSWLALGFAVALVAVAAFVARSTMRVRRPIAGGLAILVVAALGSPRLERHVVELSLGIAIFVTTLGFAVDRYTVIGGFGYGAYVGFVAAALLLLLTLPRPRLRSQDHERLPVQRLR
jgi:hypothetical protein